MTDNADNPKHMKIEDLMVDMISQVHTKEIAGASQSATHAFTNGLMLLFYFHPNASKEDVKMLLDAEYERTQAILNGEDTGDALPPKTPRFMN